MSRVNHGIGLVVCTAALGLMVGCDPSPNAKTTASAAPTEATVPAQPQKAVPRPSGLLPKDLDVAALSKRLGCGRAAKVKQACRVLREFGQAERWAWPTRSPEARWAGNAYVVSRGDDERKAMVLYGKQVPTMQVDPDMLPLKLGAGMLSEGLGSARWSLVDGISRLSRVARKNPARVAASSFTPKIQRAVQATDGASLLWVADDKAYFRQQGRKVLVVELSANVTDQHGEGTYAELWPVYW